MGTANRPLMIAMLALLFAGCAAAQSVPTREERVRLVHVSFRPVQAVPWIAREAGYFNALGLDVEFTRVGTGTTVGQSMMTGETVLAYVGVPAVIEATLAGADVAILATPVRAPLFRLMAQPALKSPSDLKGKRIGVTRFGSTTDFLIRWALINKWGLFPDRDVVLLQIGGIPEMVAAAKAEAIDAAVLSTPEDLRTGKFGWKELADFSTMGLDYPGGALVATRKYIKANEEVVRRFMKAFVQGIHRMRTDKQFTIRALEKFSRITDRDALETMYQYEVLKIEKVPLPSLTGIQTVLDEMALQHPAVKGMKPEDIVDARFVSELQASGFIDGLYK